MPDVPSWWELLLLALAAWRTFRLLAEDDILDTPRRKLLRLGKDWQPGSKPPDDYRFQLSEFITCPYCAGFWVAIAWWAAWLVWPHATTLLAVPLAINTVVIAATKLDTIGE